jgi:hypothetical protein
MQANFRSRERGQDIGLDSSLIMLTLTPLRKPVPGRSTAALRPGAGRGSLLAKAARSRKYAIVSRPCAEFRVD